MKVLWLFNHPAPYKVDMFNLLGKECDLSVIFEREKEGGRNSIFYGEEKHFNYKICKGLKWGSIESFSLTPIKELKKNKYDVVVINGWRTLTEQKTISYLKKHNIPYIFAINGGIIKQKENKLFYRIKKKYISGASLYITPDSSSANYLLHYGASKDKIRYFHYSSIFNKDVLPKPLEKKEKIKLRNELGYAKENEKLFVSSGQLIERKNFIYLVNIWKKLPSNYKLIISGEGYQKDEILRLIKENNLANVELSRYLKKKDILRLFSISDGFVFLSKEDIYGHVINEALSQGLPVISSNKVNASLNLIEDNKNGFVVSLNDEEGILKAIKSDKLESMGMDAIKTAKENTIERSMLDTLSILKEFNESK